MFPGIPNTSYEYATAVANRDLAYRAYQKALKGGRRYGAEGMSLQRYQIGDLRAEYVYWRDIVNQLELHGNTSTIVFKHIIPVDR